MLSEQWALGATNACTPPRVWVPAEAPDGWQLGRAGVHSLAMRLALPQPESAAFGVRSAAWRWHGATAQRGLDHVHPRQAQRLWPVQAQRHVVGVCSALAHYRGQRWSGRWRKQSWRQARECLQSQHVSSA